jgi:hypothetical protein
LETTRNCLPLGSFRSSPTASRTEYINALAESFVATLMTELLYRNA